MNALETNLLALSDYIAISKWGYGPQVAAYSADFMTQSDSINHNEWHALHKIGVGRLSRDFTATSKKTALEVRI
jgi:hypothetical protein